MNWFVRFALPTALIFLPTTTPARADETTPLEVVIQGSQEGPHQAEDRPSSHVDRRELDERLPRSAPDALRYEPGVFVQQSAHGQGSAFLRGRTGQQTVMLFDGIRMNTSLYRQGPNQYFFTLDAHTIHHIDVMRGGSSTRHGSDALGGVLDARPVEPTVDLSAKLFSARPRAVARYASADQDFSHRFQVDASVGKSLRFLGGFGRRETGQLESGGPVLNPLNGQLPLVPVFAPDGRTQLGTGFREFTGDARFVLALPRGRRLVAATYLYRQYDSPRTDQCPPPYAPITDCLKYDEQFRSLAYIAAEGPLAKWGRYGRLVFSYQRQHERRTFDRPGSFVKNIGRDAVDTLGISAKYTGHPKEIIPYLSARIDGGADAYFDFISSRAWTSFTDVDVTVALSRGQYIEGSRYAQGGGFVEAELSFLDRIFLRAGTRAGAVRAYAPADPISGTRPVESTWPVFVGHAGLEFRAAKPISILVSVDRSFRAPNIDDLTSRQQAGPGFQFENPNLDPEKALTVDAGVRLNRGRLSGELWGYYATVDDAIVRSLRAIADCPTETPQCKASWSRYQLVNAQGTSIITGFEVSARLRWPDGFDSRAQISYAYGSSPNPQAPPDDPSLPYETRVPISRIPPLNGSVETRWSHRSGFYAGAGLRWATLQNRLAPTDLTDARIPRGGTPGFAVVDLRAGFRILRQLIITGVLENIGDAAYRYHGSSINGPGRGFIINVEAGL